MNFKLAERLSLKIQRKRRNVYTWKAKITPRPLYATTATCVQSSLKRMGARAVFNLAYRSRENTSGRTRQRLGSKRSTC